MSNDDSSRQSQEEFLLGLKGLDVTALWTLGADNVPVEPSPHAVPHVWRYQDLRRELLRAGEVFTVHDSDRRVLGCHNPGLPDLASTDNLFAGLQLVMPGERESAHRHTSAAIRFVVEGGGAYTAVNGERSYMEPADLILTPNWQWHDHSNESDRPIIWMDGLDMPMIRRLNASFYEEYPSGRQEASRPDDASTNAFSGGYLDPTWWEGPNQHSPVVKYPWKRVEAALASIPMSKADMPPGGYVLEYTNPRTGGPVMPTLGCQIEVVPSGATTVPGRRMQSTVYNVVRGAGSMVIGGVQLTFSVSDIVAVPLWAEVSISADPGEDLVLFALTDRPVYERLNLFRK